MTTKLWITREFLPSLRQQINKERPRRVAFSHQIETMIFYTPEKKKKRRKPMKEREKGAKKGKKPYDNFEGHGTPGDHSSESEDSQKKNAVTIDLASLMLSPS